MNEAKSLIHPLLHTSSQLAESRLLFSFAYKISKFDWLEKLCYKEAELTERHLSVSSGISSLVPISNVLVHLKKEKTNTINFSKKQELVLGQKVINTDEKVSVK